MAITLSTVDIETAANPQAAIVWMHGLGADAWDFVPVAQELMTQMSGMVATRFVFPNAPVMPVTINNGYKMPAWYDILHMDLSDSSKREDEASLRASQQAIIAVLQREHTRGVPYENMLLAGFSQGCAMALQVGLRFPHRLAGLIGLSGYLPLVQTVGTEKSACNLQIPIFMAHGRQDNVIPVARAQASCQTLRDQGYVVNWHEYDMAHQVCAAEIQEISAFLRQHLPQR